MAGRSVKFRTRSTTRGSIFNWVNSESAEDDAPDSPQYFFKRTDSARRSFAMNFGDNFNSQMSMGSVDQSAHIDVYLKATTTSCIQNLIAVSVGRGLLDLPAAVAFCGYIPSFIYMVILAIQVIFFMHRTVEAPQVLGKSLSFFEDIAYECLGRTWFLIVAGGNIVGLFAYLVKVFEHEMVSLGKQLAFVKIGNFDLENAGFFEMLFLVPLLVLLLVPFANRTSAKALHMNSVVSVLVLRVIVVVLCGTSVWRLFSDIGEHYYEAVNMNLGCQLKGFSMIVFAFLGPMLLPSILADMHNPDEAKRVCNKAVGEMCLMYIAVAYFGYIGCSTIDGKMFKLDFIRVLARKGNFFTRVVRVLFTVKNFTTFPLIFSPWRRLIESFLNWEFSPAMTMNVPWALRQLIRWKQLLRNGLLLSIAVVYMIFRFTSDPDRTFQMFYAFVLVLPFITSMFFFPAWFTATLWTRSYDADDASHLAEAAPYYFGSSFAWRNDGTYDGPVRDRSSTASTAHATTAHHFKSMAGKSMAMGSRHPKIDIGIDLPKKLLKAEQRAGRKSKFRKKCARIGHSISAECSLLEPAWAKTRKGNIMIFACCCCGVAIWSAMVVDMIGEVFWTDPDERSRQALG